MKYKIYFRWNGRNSDEEPDAVVIEGETIEEIKTNGEEWFKNRGLDMQKNGIHSEKVIN